MFPAQTVNEVESTDEQNTIPTIHILHSCSGGGEFSLILRPDHLHSISKSSTVEFNAAANHSNQSEIWVHQLSKGESCDPKLECHKWCNYVPIQVDPTLHILDGINHKWCNCVCIHTIFVQPNSCQVRKPYLLLD